MHQSSYDKMENFKKNYLEDKKEEKLTILDIGSLNVNGSYKKIFNSSSWQYIGVDMSAGENVDLVIDNPYNWSKIKTESVDVLISGQAFEHIEFFWLTILEIVRVLKPEGLCCLIAPSNGFEHKYPVDCWRFYPDGFRALARFAHLEVLEVFTQWEKLGYTDGSDVWHDSVLITKKPKLPLSVKITNNVTRWIMQREINKILHN